MMWEHWYSFANDKYRSSQKAELQQQEEMRKQKEYEETMATALTMDFLSSASFEFTPSEGNGITSSLMDNTVNNVKEHEKETSVSNGGAVPKKPTEIECEIGNKTLELSKDVQDVILEIADLFLDPDVVFAMRKLKEVGKAMKNSPSANAISREVELATSSEKARQAQLSQRNEFSDIIDKKDIKKEETDTEKKQALHKPLFPSATRTETFEQFSSVMKAPKKRFGSPSKGVVPSPKSAKKSGSAANLKSLTETKMDIISDGFNVLKRKKTSKVAQSIWNEVSGMGRIVLTASDPSFYALMANLFTHLEKLQESARATQLKSELFDFIGSNVNYSRVSLNNFVNNNKFKNVCKNRIA